MKNLRNKHYQMSVQRLIYQVFHKLDDSGTRSESQSRELIELDLENQMNESESDTHKHIIGTHKEFIITQVLKLLKLNSPWMN